MRTYLKYRETTNSALYRKLHKVQHSSCSYCKWHPSFYHSSENDRWKWYRIYKEESKYPNWKLCSKNKKQWMKKKLRYIEDKHFGISIEW